METAEGWDPSTGRERGWIEDDDENVTSEEMVA